MNKLDINRNAAIQVLDYCLVTFGKSFHQDGFPKIKLLSKSKIKYDKGYYDVKLNTIVIYEKNHRSMVDFICTIIHEYIHYLQYMGDYSKIYRKYGYYGNPYEIEAETLSNKHKYFCKQYIKNKFK